MLDQQPTTFIFFAATAYAAWWFYKKGENPGGCLGWFYLLIFTTGFGLIVALVASLILRAIVPLWEWFLNLEFR